MHLSLGAPHLSSRMNLNPVCRLTVFTRWHQYERPSNTGLLGPTPLTIVIGSVQPFLHSPCRTLPIRYIAPPNFSLPPQKKKFPLPREIWTHLIPVSPVPTHHHPKNCMSIESAVFPQYTLVASEQTDGTNTVPTSRLRHTCDEANYATSATRIYAKATQTII